MGGWGWGGVSRWVRRGSWVAGMRALMIPVARVSFMQIPESRHTTQKSVLVFSDLLVSLL